MKDIDKIAFKLFKNFCILEYKLKRDGFVRGRPGKKPGIDWESYVKEVLDESLFDELSSNPIVSKMIEEPPKKQVLDDESKVIWKTQSPPENLNELLLCVRRVRNNLYHGGKFNGSWFDEIRSGFLLEASILILTAIDKL